MELDRIKEIVAGVLHVDENSITADTKFVDDLGADSLDLTSIVMEIEVNNTKVGCPAVCCGVFHFRRGKIT